MKIERVTLSDLLPDPNNARSHSKENIAAIKASLSRFEQVEPLVVQKSTNIVIGGNGRLEALRQMGVEKVDVHYMDVDNTTAKALGIALNRTAETAEWDKEILGASLQGLYEDGWELEDIGFDTSALDDFLVGESGTSGKTDPDEIPEEVEPTCKLGQLWKLGGHRLLCGDSTSKDDVDRLMAGEKADMVFTDPPYGLGYNYNSYKDNEDYEAHKALCNRIFEISDCFTDKVIITPGCNNLEMFCQLRNPTHIGCWTKTNAMSPGRVTYFWTWEPIFFYGKPDL